MKNDYYMKTPWRYLIASIGEIIPGFVHRCPYREQDFQVKNITFPEDYHMIQPSGDYKIDVLFFDKRDEKIIALKIFLRLRTADMKEFK